MKAFRNREYRLWIVTALLLAGIGMGTAGSALAAGQDYPGKTMLMIAPSKPGSGFDTTMRAVVTALTQEKLVQVPMTVMNMAGSVPGTAQIVLRYSNDPNMIAVMSTTGSLNYATGLSPYYHKDWRPIARLISAYYGIFVRQDSPYKTLGDLIKDLKSNPGGTPLSGGYSDDRLCYGALFSKAGIDITKINYAAFAGGVESAGVVLEGSAKALVSTIDDVMGLLESKQLRLLAVSPGKRMEGPLLKDIPTFREAGVDVEWDNFRYILGGKGMPDHAVKYWRETLAKMVKTPTWQDMIKKYRWGDSFLAEGIDKFLDEKQVVITDVVKKLGMDKKQKK